MKNSTASGLIILTIAGLMVLVGIAVVFSEPKGGSSDVLTSIHKSVNHFLFGVFLVVAGIVGGGIGLGIMAGGAMAKGPQSKGQNDHV